MEHFAIDLGEGVVLELTSGIMGFLSYFAGHARDDSLFNWAAHFGESLSLHCSPGSNENSSRPKPCLPCPGEKGEMRVVS
ncbi:hypothetical protein SESBI_50766 [Sesbania bispinosa]|nr:hypothetical protein SESBI_50766 [Sesbania bispinosa]